MGNVVVVTLARGARLLAELRVLLPPAQQVVQHIAPVREHVAGIVKDREADVVLEERQGHRGQTQFQVVQEQAGAAEGKAGDRVAGASLVQSEAPM